MSGYKHGGWTKNRKLYRVWGGMLSRCNNPNHPLYKNYGGRGIKVCDEWKNDFTTKYTIPKGENFDINILFETNKLPEDQKRKSELLISLITFNASNFSLFY